MSKTEKKKLADDLESQLYVLSKRARELRDNFDFRKENVEHYWADDCETKILDAICSVQLAKMVIKNKEGGTE